jgi:hypothetical protein
MLPISKLASGHLRSFWPILIVVVVVVLFFFSFIYSQLHERREAGREGEKAGAEKERSYVCLRHASSPLPCLFLTMHLRLWFYWSVIPLILIASTMTTRGTSRRRSGPKENVACPKGMWITEESLCLKFNHVKENVAKLRRCGFLHCENSSRTSFCHDITENDPFNDIHFYSVDPTTGSSCGGFPKYAISLNHFVGLCQSLEKCCKEKSGLSEVDCSNLKAYYGLEVPDMPIDSQPPTERFISFVRNTLRKEKFIVFSEDLSDNQSAVNAVNTEASVSSETPAATTATNVCEPCGPRQEEDTVSVNAELPNSSCSGSTSEPCQVRCEGIQHPRLDECVKSRGLGADYVSQYWNLVNGNIVSKQCANWFTEKEGRKKCPSCQVEYTNIRRRKHPELFSTEPQIPIPERSPTESQTFIADSDTIRECIQDHWAQSASQREFESNSEVFKLAHLLLFTCATQPIRLGAGGLDDGVGSNAKVMLFCSEGGRTFVDRRQHEDGDCRLFRVMMRSHGAKPVGKLLLFAF